jgi:hypothetical protein
LYELKYSIQVLWLSGGIIPLNSSHSIIERPEFVNLVKPPTIIIENTKKNDNESHKVKV